MSKKKTKTKAKTKAKTKKSTGFRKFLRVSLFVILGFFVCSILTTILYRWVNPPITPLMLIRKVQTGATIQHQWVDMKNISPYLVNCAVAAEDNHFLGHRGFDVGAIQKALDERERGRFRGASTISQQTAKNVFLWQGKTWLRKGLEVYFTFLIETFWSKERIMEVYLNVIEMGNGIYGAEAAAQHYFNKSAKKINAYQAGLIVAAFPNPRKRNPGSPTSYLSGRAQKIVALSKKIGSIKFDERSIEQAQKRYERDVQSIKN
jgi:monofunctional biosynthetic peptidoglycan transglycosylase